MVDKARNRAIKQKSYEERKRNRLDLQVFAITAVIVVLSCSIIFVINYFLAYDNMISELKNRAISLHEYLDDKIDNEVFTELNDRGDHETRLYKSSKEMLENIRMAAGVRYLYTAKRNDAGEFIYLVDGLPSDSEDFRYVGDPIEPECVKDMTLALSGQTVYPNEITRTSWGSIFISYFPMHSGDEVIGVLGIEFDAERQFSTFRTMEILTPVVILIACIAAAFIAVAMFKRISNPSLKVMANTDFLTGAKNRNAFELSLHNRRRGPDRSPLAIISIDLDGLKAVNDAFGHDKGDEYIRAACALVKECLGGGDALFRIGGDEFVVLMPDADEQKVTRLTRAVMEKAGQFNSKYYKMSLSIGSAIFDGEKDQTLFDTLRRSDEAMYAVKRAKKQE